MGSSPLSRGIRAAVWARVRPLGIIPALAGNTTQRLDEGDGPGDHPRSRGEYAEVSIPPELLGGSSPLSRGIRGVATPARRR